MSGSVEDVCGDALFTLFRVGSDGDELAVFERVVGGEDGWRGDT